MRRTLLPPLIFLAPLVWLFRRALFMQEMFAFRDSSHYYYPLYKYVQERWRGGVPLWNPLDNLGQPLLGDPTAAVLYPGKLVFALPFEYSCCFALYVVLHLWLAGCGAYVCARTFRATRNGALLCGLSYELSGQVLFQYCNPIFCVGAAWLPWAFVFFEQMIQGSSRVRTASDGANKSARSGAALPVVLFAVVLSLMVFGGDPQLAYHCLMACGLRLLFFRPPQCSIWRGVQLLLASSVIALLLSAVQVFPSFVWASQSDRALVDAPRSIFEWTAQAGNEDAVGIETLAMKPTRRGHSTRIYDFSVGPWRWPELLWPNISGPMFPVHGRWLTALPGASRIWTPTLYLGLLPMLLAIGRLRMLRGSPVLRWLSWLTILSVVAALGNFGAGWLINECRFQLSSDDYAPSGLLPGFGGLYWLLTVALPGYASFRYPAKWWTLASLGFALLAAKGWPLLWSRRVNVRRYGYLLLATLVPTLVAAYCLMQRNVAANAIFGPLQRDVAWRAVSLGVVQVGVLLFATIAFRRFGSRRQSFWLVMILLVDLLFAQRSLIQTRPVIEWNSRSIVSNENATFFRSWPSKTYPKEWASSSSWDRFGELKRHDTMTLMPKHQVLVGARSLRSSVSITSADYAMVWEMCREVDSDAVPLLLLTSLGAKYVLAPAGDYSMVSESFAAPSNLVRYRNQLAMPRASLVTDWESIGRPTPNGLNRAALFARTRRVWIDRGEFRDLAAKAFVETDVPPPSNLSDSLSGNAPSGERSCLIVEDEPERVVINVRTDCPAILVLRDQYNSGWQANFVEKANASAELLRVNSVMRGVYCEPGEHTVELRYRPREVYVGAIVSGLAWLTIIVGGTFTLRRTDPRSGS